MNLYLSRWINTATFLFFALSLSVKSGYSYGASLLFFPALFSLPWWWRKRRRDAVLRHITLALLAAGTLGVLDAWFSGLGATFYNLPAKYLCIPILLYFLATFPPDARAIWAGAACGAIFGALTSAYYVYFAPEMLTMGRGARYLHPIQFGNIAVILVLLSACGLSVTKNRAMRLLLACGTLAGVYAALLSETRGSLLSLAFFLVCLGFMNAKHILPARKSAFVALLFLMTFMLLAGGEIIAKRVADIAQDLHLYQQGDSATSIGARFELWRFAWEEGWRYPLWGPGTAQLFADKAAWFAGHPAQELIGTLGHLHNEFIDAFARRGLLGLATVIALFALPLRFFSREGQPALRIAACGYILLYIGFGMTQTTLYSHNSGFLFFTIPLCVFYGICLSSRPSFVSTP